jgi:hypothetical protein
MVANRSMRATAASGATRCGWRSRAINAGRRRAQRCYARTVEQLLADHTLGGIAIDLREGDLAESVINREAGHRPIAAFELSVLDRARLS